MKKGREETESEGMMKQKGDRIKEKKEGRRGRGRRRKRKKKGRSLTSP
jgi:hypothetical protein